MPLSTRITMYVANTLKNNKNKKHLQKLLSTVGIWLLAAVSVIILSSSVAAQEVDSVNVTLDEVSVIAVTPPIPIHHEGKLTLNAATVRNAPSLLGNPDLFRMLQTMSEVSTNNDFSAGISVNGMDYSHNYIAIDGMHIINPFHMLGLFSAFNTDHLSRYVFSPFASGAAMPDVLGGVIEAYSGRTMSDNASGNLTVGLINSSLALTLPFGRDKRNSVAVAMRYSYIDKIFPDMLKYDHANLLYRFGDANFAYNHEFNDSTRLQASFFYSADRMKMRDTFYDSDALFKWNNVAAGLKYESPHQRHSIYWSRFANTFDVRESTFFSSLPSSFMEAGYKGEYNADRWNAGIDATYRHTSPQNPSGNVFYQQKDAAEISAFAGYRFVLLERVVLTPSVRATVYATKGFTRIYPMPRLTLNLQATENLTFTAIAGRTAQFTHLVKESDTGLPANFWINASATFRPQTSWFASVAGDASVAGGMINCHVEAYYRSLRNFAEFDGSILNVLNGAYDPLADVRQGNGCAYGLSTTVSFRYDSFRSWIAYNIGRSKVRIPEIAGGYFPVNYDRLHDLNLTATYSIGRRFHFSLTAAYATGTPYTKAAFGYMLGENLICEYYPHNSSRLPDYFRLDFAFGWDFGNSRHLHHRLDLSCYNITAHNNVMFEFYHYSPDEGLVRKESSFRSIIPSISYTLSFR